MPEFSESSRRRCRIRSPKIVALGFREVDLDNRAEKLPEELSASRFVESVQGLHKEIQERVL